MERSYTEPTSHPAATAATDSDGAPAVADYMATSGSCGEAEEAALMEAAGAAAAAAAPGYVPGSGAGSGAAATACSPNRPAVQQQVPGMNNASSYRQLRVDVPGSSWLEHHEQHCSYEGGPAGSWLTPHSASDAAAAAAAAASAAAAATAVADIAAGHFGSGEQAGQDKQQWPASTYNSSEASSCGGSPALLPGSALTSVTQPAGIAALGPGCGPMGPGSYITGPGAAAAVAAAAAGGHALRHTRQEGINSNYAAPPGPVSSCFSAGTGTYTEGALHGSSSLLESASYQQPQQYHPPRAAGPEEHYTVGDGAYPRHSGPQDWCGSSFGREAGLPDMPPAAAMHPYAPSGHCGVSNAAPPGYTRAGEVPDRGPVSSMRGEGQYWAANSAPGVGPPAAVQGMDWAAPQQDRSATVDAVLRSAAAPNYGDGGMYSPRAQQRAAGQVSNTPVQQQQQRGRAPEQQLQQAAQKWGGLCTVGSTMSLDSHMQQHTGGPGAAAAGSAPAAGGMLMSFGSSLSVNTVSAAPARAATAGTGGACEPGQAEQSPSAAAAVTAAEPALTAAVAAAGDGEAMMADAASPAAAQEASAAAAGQASQDTTEPRVSSDGSPKSEQRSNDMWAACDMPVEQQAAAEPPAAPGLAPVALPGTSAAASGALAAMPGTPSSTLQQQQQPLQVAESPKAAQQGSGSAAPGCIDGDQHRSSSMPAPGQPEQQRMQRGYSSYTELSSWPSMTPPEPTRSSSLVASVPNMLSGPPSGPQPGMSGPAPGPLHDAPAAPHLPPSPGLHSGPPYPQQQPGQQLPTTGIMDAGYHGSYLSSSRSYPGPSSYAPAWPRGMPPPLPGPAGGPYPPGPMMGPYPPGPCDCWECRQAAAAGIPGPAAPPLYGRPPYGSSGSYGPEARAPGGFGGPVRSRSYGPSFRPHPYELPGSVASSGGGSRYQQQYGRDAAMMDGPGFYYLDGGPGAAPGPGFYYPQGPTGPGPVPPAGLAHGQYTEGKGFAAAGRVVSAPNLMMAQAGRAAGWQEPGGGAGGLQYSQQQRQAQPGMEHAVCQADSMYYPGPEECVPPQSRYNGGSYSNGSGPQGLQRPYSAEVYLPPAAAGGPDRMHGPLVHRSMSMGTFGSGFDGSYDLPQQQHPGSWANSSAVLGSGPGMSTLQQQQHSGSFARASTVSAPYYAGPPGPPLMPRAGSSNNISRYSSDWQLHQQLQQQLVPGLPVHPGAAGHEPSRPDSRHSSLILQSNVVKGGSSSRAMAASMADDLLSGLGGPACSSAAGGAAAMLGPDAAGLDLEALELERDGLMGVLDDMLAPCDVDDELLMIA